MESEPWQGSCKRRRKLKLVKPENKLHHPFKSRGCCNTFKEEEKGAGAERRQSERKREEREREIEREDEEQVKQSEEQCIISYDRELVSVLVVKGEKSEEGE